MMRYGGDGEEGAARKSALEGLGWKRRAGKFLKIPRIACFRRAVASAGWRSLINVVKLRVQAVYSAVRRRLKQ